MSEHQAIVQRLVEKFKKQLDVSDQYAKDVKPKDTSSPTVWELQNGHIRDLVTELEIAMQELL